MARKCQKVEIPPQQVGNGDILTLKHKIVGLVISGSRCVYSDGHRVKINKGQIFLLCEGLHYIVDSPDSYGNPFKAVTIEITTQMIQQAMVSMINDYGIMPFEISGNHHSATAPNVLVCNPSESSAKALLSIVHAGPNIKSTSVHITEMMYQFFINQQCSICRRLFSPNEIQRAQFVSHIHNSLLSNATINHLAEQNNCSATTFKSQFRAIFDDTPHKWRVEQRLNLSCALLLSTTLTVAQIGEICAFSHTSHFIRLFKRRYNLTPLAFRRQNGGGVKIRHYPKIWIVPNFQAVIALQLSPINHYALRCKGYIAILRRLSIVA